MGIKIKTHIDLEKDIERKRKIGTERKRKKEEKRETQRTNRDLKRDLLI